MPFQDYGYKPSGITRPRARPKPKATSSSYYSGNEFGSGNIFTETSSGASTVNFGNNNNNDNDRGSSRAPSLVQAPTPTVTAPAAPTPAQIEAERQDRIARVFEAAGATLPEDKGRMGRVGRGIDLYSRDIFTTPYVATPDNTQEIRDYLQRTAVDDALRDALGMPEVYQGTPSQEESETNIDMSVLQGALQPEPITVEELPDVITKAGDTLSDIAASVDLPLQAVIDANPQIANPDMIRPGQKINMPSRQVTSEERTALTYMSDITKSQAQTITSNGTFSLPKLKSAVKGSIGNTKKQAMLEGIVDVEVGTDGPVTESSYSLSNLEGFTGAWRQRSIDAGLLDRNGNATALARQLNSQGALGDTIFDVQYAGRNGNGDLASGDGSTFKGRGLVQITGRQNYQEVQNRLQEQGINIDLINNPELVNDERYALPAAIAYLDYAGMTDSAAEEMSARKLQVIINPDAPVATAEERWESAITALRAEDPVAAAAMEKRNEYEAQRTVGTVVDGMIGTNSESAMRSWLQQEGVTVPANATGMDLVVLVNENS